MVRPGRMVFTVHRQRAQDVEADPGELESPLGGVGLDGVGDEAAEWAEVLLGGVPSAADVLGGNEAVSAGPDEVGVLGQGVLLCDGVVPSASSPMLSGQEPAAPPHGPRRAHSLNSDLTSRGNHATRVRERGT